MPAELNLVHLGDVGFVVELTVEEDGAAVNISTATSLKVWLRPPRGAVIEKTGTLISSGTTGKFGYTFVSGDLPINDEARHNYIGTWTAEGTFTLGAWSGTTTAVQFRVEDVLRAA